MRSIWVASVEASHGQVPSTLPEHRGRSSGPVTVTTGLGLPLSRGLASACDGWLALDDSRSTGMTLFWCVLRVTPPPMAQDIEDIRAAPAPLPAPRLVPHPSSNACVYISCLLDKYCLDIPETVIHGLCQDVVELPCGLRTPQCSCTVLCDCFDVPHVVLHVPSYYPGPLLCFLQSLSRLFSIRSWFATGAFKLNTHLHDATMGADPRALAA